MALIHLNLVQMHGPSIRQLFCRIIGVLILGCLLQSEATSAPAKADNSASAGRGMFFGGGALHGTILGHSEALSPRVASCANCHLNDAGVRSSTSFAPTLDRDAMTELRSRRGGPPSLFSPTSFCRMLRTGVDPVYVLITRQMPRYTLSDDQCLDLWRYLMETSDGPDGN